MRRAPRGALFRRGSEVELSEPVPDFSSRRARRREDSAIRRRGAEAWGVAERKPFHIVPALILSS